MAEQDLNQVAQDAVQQTPPQGMPNASGSSQDAPVPFGGGYTASQLNQRPTGQPGANAAPSGPPPEAVADIGHHYGLGKIVQSLFGNDRSYTVDPKTGQTVSQDSPSKPGQIWRNIIAGVVLGGAAGQEKGGGTFLGGAVQGSKAEIQEKQKQDAQNQENARKDFQQSQEATKTASQVDLMKAQTAFHNAETLRTMVNAENMGYDYHEKLASAGRARLEPLLKGGLPYKFQDIPQTDIQALIEKNPDAAHYQWEATGTKLVNDKNGNPMHVSTLSAVDPKPGTFLKVTDDNIKNMKDAGLEKVYGPEIWNHLVKDHELPIEQFRTFSQMEKGLVNDKFEKDKRDRAEKDVDSQIAQRTAQAELFKAEAKKNDAEAARYKSETGKENKKNADYKKALDNFDKAKKQFGEDKAWENIGSYDQNVIADKMKVVSDEKRDIARAAIAAGEGDSPEAKKNYKDWIALSNLKPIPITGGGKDKKGVVANTEAVQNTVDFMRQQGKGQTPQDAYAYISSSSLKPEEMSAAFRATGAEVPWKAIVSQSEATKLPVSVIIKKIKDTYPGIKLEYNSQKEHDDEVQKANENQPIM